MKGEIEQVMYSMGRLKQRQGGSGKKKKKKKKPKKRARSPSSLEKG